MNNTMGIGPGDAILVVEHRGAQDIVHNALVASISMREELKGRLGEPAIEAVFINVQRASRDGTAGLELFAGVCHISHLDWLERRASLGYEELPGPTPGVCRYCRCTEARACEGGCRWLFPEHTVCSAPACEAKFVEDNMMRTAGRAI